MKCSIKKILIVCCLLVIQGVSAQHKKYHDLRDSNYSIRYSETFVRDENTTKGASFVLKIPRESALDNFSANINLLIQDLDTLNYNLDQYVELTEQQIKSHVELFDSQRIKRGNMEYHAFTFGGMLMGYNVKFLQYDFVQDNKAYILTYTAKKDQFDVYFVEAKEVMDSFVLKK